MESIYRWRFPATDHLGNGVEVKVDQLIPSHDRAKARFSASHLFMANRADYPLQGLLRWTFVSRNEANTAYRPSVIVAYTNDGHLRDSYR